MIRSIEIKQDMSMLDVCNMAYGELDLMIPLMIQNGITDLLNNIGKTVSFDTVYSLNVLSNNNSFANSYIFATSYEILQGLYPSLLQENGFYLLQENGFKIIL